MKERKGKGGRERERERGKGREGRGRKLVPHFLDESYAPDKSARNPGFLLIIIGWGESGKVILQVSIAVFRALTKIFSGNEGSAPLEKIGPYAYASEPKDWQHPHNLHTEKM